VELMWDQMWRATINYGRKGLTLTLTLILTLTLTLTPTLTDCGRTGLPIQCISAVDLALWDLLGKLRNEPVYALLGGKVHVHVYVQFFVFFDNLDLKSLLV